MDGIIPELLTQARTFLGVISSMIRASAWRANMKTTQNEARFYATSADTDP